MNILFIAPLPPPITGHSKCAELLYKHLKLDNHVKLVNLSKNNFKNGKFDFFRFLQILKIFFLIFKYKNKCDKVYFTISQSFGGNIKDLLIYIILINKLDKTTIHLHGGSIKTNLFDKYNLIYKINNFFYNKIKNIVILGESHIKIFDAIVNINNIYIVKNFYEKIFLLNINEINIKFNEINIKKLKILFLSNMQKEKGYLHIINAISLMNINYLNNFEFHFAGKFDNIKDKLEFKSKIDYQTNIFYHDFVDGSIKKELLKNTHILCLPTTFLEGQPISIIEAYASGLVVLAPLQGGIVDIFNINNGYPIESNEFSILTTLQNILFDKKSLLNIALYNNSYVKESFDLKNHLNQITSILKN